jgi:hypothetical protein
MRRLVVSVFFAAALAHEPAFAQEAEALRRELEQMREQFEKTRQEYQKAMERMQERLQRLETAPPVSPAPPVAAPAPTKPSPTLMDYATPRAPFGLAERTGRGQLLFDIGVAADFIANFTSRNVDHANVGTFAGLENRFFPREIELSLFGQIDPYARGVVRIEAAEEFENGERTLQVNLAEAYLTLLTLPFGTQLKLGFMRNRFGLLNEVHQHDLPQPDRPDVLVNFFGEEGLVESGVELTWVAPLPFYLELLGGVFDGDNDVAFGRGNLRNPLWTGRIRTFFELGDYDALQLGASVATGQTSDRLQNTIFGLDAKYKHTPEGWRHALLTAGGEALWGWRKNRVTSEVDVEVDTDGDGIPDTTETVETSDIQTRKPFGFYVYTEVRPWRQWLGGLRFDWSEFPTGPGREWAIEPYIAYLPSEFLRFRLGFKHTARSRSAAEGFEDARIANEVFLQATFILGAHPAHPF